MQGACLRSAARPADQRSAARSARWL